MRLTVAATSLALAGCVGHSSAQSASRELDPLPRSSIAAVLEHADELRLTDAQLARLEQADDSLAARIEAARTERPRGGGDAAGATAVTGHTYEGTLAPGQGSGDTRGYDIARRKPARRPRAPARPLPEQFDDLDAEAMLGVESVFTPAQHDLAMRWASAYRAALVERRAQLDANR